MLDKARNLPVQGGPPSDPGSPYMPDMGPEDYAPPEWRLVQPTSQAHTEGNVALGSYYCEQTTEAAAQLDMVILRVQRNRTYWRDSDLSFPACSSDDRIMPRPGGAYAGPCATCEANGKGCYPGYNLLCVRLDQQGKPEPSEMFLLRVTGTSVYPFRRLWSRIHLAHQDNPWSIAITLGSQKKENEKGTYWVMQPDIAQEFTYQADLKLLKALADGLAVPLEEGRHILEPEAMQQHHQAEDIPAKSPEQNRPPAATTPPQPRAITREEAQDVIFLAKRLGVQGETISPFIQNTFGKDRLSQLHIGELGMLTKWLVQELGHTEPAPPKDDLPF